MNIHVSVKEKLRRRYLHHRLHKPTHLIEEDEENKNSFFTRYAYHYLGFNHRLEGPARCWKGIKGDKIEWWLLGVKVTDEYKEYL